MQDSGEAISYRIISVIDHLLIPEYFTISLTHFRGRDDSPLGSTFMRLNECLALRARHPSH